MEQFPLAICKIIERYARDMTLLEQTPIPIPSLISHPIPFYLGDAGSYSDFLMMHILDVVSSSKCAFHRMTINQIIHFPDQIINDFEIATDIWKERLALYGLPDDSLNPIWKKSLPYIIVDFIGTFDLELLQIRLKQWVNIFQPPQHLPVLL